MWSGLVGQSSLAHLEKQGRSTRAASLLLEAAEAATRTRGAASRAMPQKPARQELARASKLTSGEFGSRYGKLAEFFSRLILHAPAVGPRWTRTTYLCVIEPEACSIRRPSVRNEPVRSDLSRGASRSSGACLVAERSCRVRLRR